MVYYVAGVSYSSNDLYHHGIKGQRWGTKNGPPYPLKSSDHSKAEKEAASSSKTKSNVAFKIDKKTLITVGKVAAVAALATVGVIAVKKISEERSILDSQRKYGQMLSDEMPFLYNSDEQKHGTVDKIKRYFSQRENESEFDSESSVYKKKREMSVDEDLLYVNPEYGSYDRAGHNCGLCSMTYDLRRRGYDVTAGFSDSGITLGTIKAFYRGSTEKILAGDYYINTISNNNLSTKPLTERSAIKAVNQLSKEPPNSRGMLSLMWAGRSNGHMVSYEVDGKGELRVIDGQTSKIYYGKDIVNLFTKSSALASIRVDNCEPNIQSMVKFGVIR